VLTKPDKCAIFDRIEAAFKQVGLTTRVEIAGALTETGYPTSTKTLGSWACGDSAPNAERLIGISKLTRRSPYFILTGEKEPALQLEQIESIVSSVKADLGIQTIDLTPGKRKIMEALKKADDNELRFIEELVERLGLATKT
jgi:hypothetical protein